ncbi:hypothetical protein ACWGS9_34300 [Bradyrhizobium sp. Arg314]
MQRLAKRFVCDVAGQFKSHFDEIRILKLRLECLGELMEKAATVLRIGKPLSAIGEDLDVALPALFIGACADIGEQRAGLLRIGRARQDLEHRRLCPGGKGRSRRNRPRLSGRPREVSSGRERSRPSATPASAPPFFFLFLDESTECEAENRYCRLCVHRRTPVSALRPSSQRYRGDGSSPACGRNRGLCKAGARTWVFRAPGRPFPA